MMLPKLIAIAGKYSIIKVLLSLIVLGASSASASFAEEQVVNFQDVCRYSNKLKSHDGLELIEGLCKVPVEEISASLIRLMLQEASDFYSEHQMTLRLVDYKNSRKLFIAIGILGMTRLQLDSE